MIQEFLKLQNEDEPPYFKDLFTEQKGFIRDKSRYKAAYCSRRAGKSHTVAAYLLLVAATRPDTQSVYIALTRKSAKRIIWNVFKRMNHKYELGLQFKESDLEIVHPNGSQIYLYGANDENVAETLRGNPYALVAIDECASYRGHITDLIDDILMPALIDHRGSLVLVGSPSDDFTSYFYQVSTKPEMGFTTHHWTMFNNPHIKDPQEFIDDVKKRKGWRDDNPRLLREYYGKWVRSDDDAVYKYNPLKNVYTSLPRFKMHYVVGMDLGFNDATTISVLGFNQEESDCVYIIKTIKRSRLSISNTATIVKQIVEEYDPIRMVADCGGLGKSIVEEIRERHHIHFKAAEKTEKFAYIELLNADLQDGRIKVAENNPVVEEWQDIRFLKQPSGRLVEDPSQPNDCADSVLYAWRECKHFFHKPRVQKTELDKMEETIMDNFNRKQDDWMFE